MEILAFIADQMEQLGIPYEFGEWTAAVQYPYFVGELTEEEPYTEDGMELAEITLNGFHRGQYQPLEIAKDAIKKHFDHIHGLRFAAAGCAIVAFYGGAFYVPTGEAELKRIQIRLTIKKWKGA